MENNLPGKKPQHPAAPESAADADQRRGLPAALQKRAKRHVGAAAHDYLAVCQKSLLPVLEAEMTAQGLGPLVPGEAGIEASGRLEQIWKACLVLGSAARVLVRVASFRAGAAEELFRRTAALPWELWLDPRLPLGRVTVEATVFHSRLQHEGAAADAVGQAVRQRLEAARAGLEGELDEAGRTAGASFDSDALLPQRLMLRLHENQAQLSLDTAPEGLHRRGYRALGAGAPIREDLAGALLRWACGQLGWNRLPLVHDAMCGSGTFAIEAALMQTGRAPGAVRVAQGSQFAFEEWTTFRPAAFSYLVRQLQGGAQSQVVARDLDPKAAAATRANASRAGVSIATEAADFFHAPPPAAETGAPPGGLVVLNPPYGRLLDQNEGLYRRIGARLGQAYQGWHALVLSAAEDDSARLGLKPLARMPLRHGGLKIWASLYAI